MNFIENETPAKLRGGYYTDPDIARFLARWVFEISPERILEPSCGDGAFFDAISQLDPGKSKTLIAFESDPDEAEKAARRIRDARHIDAGVYAEDYLKWSLLNINKPLKLDAVLGNPPFIRYQYLDDMQQSLMQNIFEVFHLHFTKHTNAWVPFVILSISQLRPGGRLAMVVPSEILHVLHAQSLRTFLCAQCSKIVVIDPEELWFSDTLQGVVLLLAEKRSSENDRQHGVAIEQVREREFLTESPSAIFNRADFSNGDVIEGKWMPALLSKSERELLKDIVHRERVYRFGDIADVDVGIVTGANKFFLVTDQVVDEYELSRWAHPMFGRSEHVRGVIYDEESHERNRSAGFPTNFLWFGTQEFSHLPERAQDYIRSGEAEGLPRRYKCRIRSPWYDVPSVYSAPVAMLKRCHNFPRLILNTARAYTTDTAYRIRLTEAEPKRLVYSFVNSLTALSAELEGRHYGGGVLELVPSEIERLIVPMPRVSVLLKNLDKKLRSGISLEELFSMQDGALLKDIGLDETEREDVFAAWTRLRMRRQRSQNRHEEDDAQSISMKNGSSSSSLVRQQRVQESI